MGTAAVVGAVVAVRGLNTWNRQLRGQTEYELARRLLRATYNFREAIFVVRQPFLSIPDIPDQGKLEDASSMSKEKLRWLGRRIQVVSATLAGVGKLR